VTSRGRYAVKEWFAAPDPALVEEHTRFAERARRLGVCTPRTYRDRSGAAVHLVHETPVVVFEWVDLLPRTRALDPAAVGRLVAGLHRAGPPAAGPVDNWFSSMVPEPAWEELLTRLKDADAPFAPALESFVDVLGSVSGALEAPRDLRTCHRDLWSDNVLAAADGRTCVIDFDNCGPADPSHELAMVLYEFGLDDPGRMRSLVAAYEDAGGPGRVERPGQFTMLVAQDAHLAQIAGSRWLGAGDQVERDRIERWFCEIVDDPETPQRLQRILDAVV
jgi:Ser/Thr protein kinase RdoA (MazF antagonist)